MDSKKILNNLIEQNHGIVKTSQVVSTGISKTSFYEYVKKNNMKQVAHGVYASENAWVDSMFVLHLRCPQAIFSHDTALYFYDLTDREPSPYSVTVKRGYNATHLKDDGVKVYTVKEELYNLGITSVKTPYGREISAYDMERTICDLMKARNNLETQTLFDAIKSYVSRKDKNLMKLMQYASKLRVEKDLRKYMEILL